MASYTNNLLYQLNAKVSIAYDSSANWETTNPILVRGQIAMSADLGVFKVGDGRTHWADLPYNNAETLVGLRAKIKELNYVRGVTSPIQEQIDALSETMNDQVDTIAEHTETLANHEERITQAEEDIIANNDDRVAEITSLQHRMENAENNITWVSDRATTNMHDITSINGEIDSMDVRVRTLEEREQVIIGAATSIVKEDLTPEKVVVSDEEGKIAVSNITSQELSYLAGTKRAVQTQLNEKEETVTGAATTITKKNLTPNRMLMSDDNGKVVATDITKKELNFLAGIKNNIQEQIDSKQTKGDEYQHPQYETHQNGVYKITVDNLGHVLTANPITRDDLHSLGMVDKSRVVITNSNANIHNANEVTPNGYVFLNFVEDWDVVSTNQIIGIDATTVTTDTEGNLIVTSHDTHHQAKNVVTSSRESIATTTDYLDNGNVYLNLVENEDVRSSFRITGSGATTVTTDNRGNIIIDSANTTSLDGMSGTLSVPSGGTGQTSFPAGELLIGNGTTSIQTRQIDETVGGTNNSNKVISSGAVYAGLALKVDKTSLGAVSGVATLDANGHVPASQLPSYVDDVLTYPSAGDFPSEGDSGKIYVADDDNLTYRWTGTDYVVIPEGLALGETESTAFRGDWGKEAYDHIFERHARWDATKTEASGTNGNIWIDDEEYTVYTHPEYEPVESGLYKITVDDTGHVSGVESVTKDDITSLGVPSTNTDTHYTSKNVVANSAEGLEDTTVLIRNGDVYLNEVENNTIRSAHNIIGAGATTVTAAVGGAITISSTNTTYNALTSEVAITGTDTEDKLVSAKTLSDLIASKNYSTTTGTVTSVATGVGLTGGPVTSTGTLKAALRSETALTKDSVINAETEGRIYPVAVDKSGYLAVNVPWVKGENTDTHYTSHLYVGTGAEEDGATTNGNTKVTLYENGSANGSFTIKGEGGILVSSDTDGNITISVDTSAIQQAIQIEDSSLKI